MPEPIRHRIKGHRRVRAGELVPHEWNFREHPAGQRAALEALYREVGFARSLLAYELPDGRRKLIDGHLRRDMDPDMEAVACGAGPLDAPSSPCYFALRGSEASREAPMSQWVSQLRKGLVDLCVLAVL